jgi:hypothetical protein
VFENAAAPTKLKASAVPPAELASIAERSISSIPAAKSATRSRVAPVMPVRTSRPAPPIAR